MEICEKFVVWGPVAKVQRKKRLEPSKVSGWVGRGAVGGYTPLANKPTHTTN